MHVLAAWIRGIYAAGGGAGMPRVDGRVELHSGIATCPCRLDDHVEYFTRTVLTGNLAALDKAGLPGAVIQHGTYEIIGRAHRVVGVLKEQRTVGGAVER